MDDVLGIDEAVAGVHHHRRRIGRQPLEQVEDGGSGDLGVLVCHVARLRHRRRREHCVAEHMYAGHALGLERQPVDVDPGIVDQRQARGGSDVACSHGRNHVEHVGLDRVELELGGERVGVDALQRAVGHVFDQRAVALEGLGEQRLLRLDLAVGVEHQHLGFRLGVAQVVGDQAGALVGSGRTAVGRARDVHCEHAAIGHGLELLAQQHGLRASLPGVRDAFLVALESADPPRQEVDAGRQHEAVPGNRAMFGRGDRLLVDVDRGGFVGDQLHAPLRLQVFVADRDVFELLDAADDEVRDRARHEGGVALDEGDVDRAVAPHAQVLRRGCAAVAAAHDDDVVACLCRCRHGVADECGEGARAGRSDGCRFDESASIQHLARLRRHFCAANQVVIRSSCASV